MIVYINNRNLLTWPRAMADILAKQGHDVIIVDNDSTYEPLLDYYEYQCPHDVILLGENLGHTAPWTIIDHHEEYVVTDPDLDISGIPADWPEVLHEGMMKYGGGKKCGFTLDETRIPSQNPAWILDDFCAYPDGYPPRWWPQNMLPGTKTMYQKLLVDTTFALYSAGRGYSIDGVRAGRPYTARHLPWHIVLDVNPKEDSLQIPMDEELYFYYTHASDVSNTKGRLKAMLAEYAERHHV